MADLKLTLISLIKQETSFSLCSYSNQFEGDMSRVGHVTLVAILFLYVFVCVPDVQWHVTIGVMLSRRPDQWLSGSNIIT